MAIYTCPICKQQFSRRGKRKPRTCSLKCYAESMEGIKRPAHICKKISLHHSRHNLGTHHSLELRKRMSESRKGKYIGKSHWNYNGGITKGIEQKCIICNKIFTAKYWGKKYCSHKCYWSTFPQKYIHPNGYVLIHRPDHPFAGKDGYIAEHRLVAESILKRYLTKKEVIHHIDENRQNNHPSNLYLFAISGEHLHFHHLKRKNPSLQLTSNIIG